MSWRSESRDGLSYVGDPVTLYRVTGALYADQAEHYWDTYVCATLAGSQGVGGRFNPESEFGALYTADDEATAWEEAAARNESDGVTGLPASTRLLNIVVAEGRYADLRENEVREDFQAELGALNSDKLTKEERENCWKVARAVRALADFLISQSARAGGNNVPLYPDRANSELAYTLAAVHSGRVPPHLLQHATESW